MKRTLIAGLILGLVAGSLFAPATAAKKKKKKPAALVQADQKMFLRGAGCEVESFKISVTDAADKECGFLRAGLIYDVGEGHPAPVGSDSGPWQSWPAADGLPFKLDATKAITGEIGTEPYCPLVACPVPRVSVGQVKFIVKLLGVTGGQETTLGEFVEEFTHTPGDPPHISKIEIKLDPALNGSEFTSLTLMTRISGNSVNHGVYKLDNPSSFVTIPTLVPAS